VDTEGAADLVLTGGAVYTVDAARSWAQAVAISDGRIAAVGRDADMRPYVGPHTEVVNLRGRMLLPGFQDAHVHASGGGLERSQCDLTGEHTRQGYLAAIRSYADRTPGAAWITGGGWGMDVFPGGVPSKDDLDAVVPDRPVFLSNRDHHGAWVNSRALELARVDAATPDPPDGRIERTPAGEPQGTLHEGAMNLVRRVVPAVTLEEQMAGILEGQRYLHSLGITAWQEAIVGEYAVVPDCFEAYREVDGRGVLTARVTGALWWRRSVGLSQLDFLTERRSIADVSRFRATGVKIRSVPGGPRFRATSVKIMQDGVCENFTAAMLAPYLDGHGHETEGRGTSFFDPEELKEAVTAIDARGFQVHIHAIGDRAVREALDAIAAARDVNGPSRGRHHIAHLQVIHPEDVPRFRDLSVVANCQPLWASNEPQMTELTLPFLGPERSAWQYPFGSLARSGAQLCFGSDWPVSSPNPMWEMHTAVNRTTAPDYPFRGPDTDTPFLPGERIGLPAAIAAFTIGSAYVNHDERDAGSIEAGKRADLVVLDRNLFTQPSAEIAHAEVDLTLVDGTVVHTRSGT
jgi:predicted amidohydrolase YtcJ